MPCGPICMLLWVICYTGETVSDAAGAVHWANLANAQDGISIGSTVISADNSSANLSVLVAMYASAASQASLLLILKRPVHG